MPDDSQNSTEESVTDDSQNSTEESVTDENQGKDGQGETDTYKGIPVWDATNYQSAFNEWKKTNDISSLLEQMYLSGKIDMRLWGDYQISSRIIDNAMLYMFITLSKGLTITDDIISVLSEPDNAATKYTEDMKTSMQAVAEMVQNLWAAANKG